MAEHSSNACKCGYRIVVCVHHVNNDPACTCISCRVDNRDLMRIQRTCSHCHKSYIGTDYGFCSNCGRFQYLSEGRTS